MATICSDYPCKMTWQPIGGLLAASLLPFALREGGCRSFFFQIQPLLRQHACEDVGRRNAPLTRQHESQPTTIAAPSTTALEKATHPPRGGGVPSSRRDQQVRCCHRHVRNRLGGNRSPIVTSGTGTEEQQDDPHIKDSSSHLAHPARLISTMLNYLSLLSTVITFPRLP